MDIDVTVTDENGEVLDIITVYQDGSDSEAAARVRQMVTAEYPEGVERGAE